MRLIELAQECGVRPIKVASTEGGEYHSACPICGGKDRFIIQPLWKGKGRYYCRQCDRKGDAIQFCREFLGMDYRSACAKVGEEPKTTFSPRRSERVIFMPEITPLPPHTWQEKAKHFMVASHQQLMRDIEGVQLLKNRGFSVETMRSFSLGWNPSDLFFSYSEWGLPPAFHEDNREKKLHIPRGIVIPAMRDSEVIKLKIRCISSSPGEQPQKKYSQVPGGMKSPALYGTAGKSAIVLVESELDAMLVIQQAGDMCSCMAICGSTNKPDSVSDTILKKASLVLFALDFDEAGKKAYQFWKSTYPNLKPWPVPSEKSPGDAHLVGYSLREWILNGLKRHSRVS